MAVSQKEVPVQGRRKGLRSALPACASLAIVAGVLVPMAIDVSPLALVVPAAIAGIVFWMTSRRPRRRSGPRRRWAALVVVTGLLAVAAGSVAGAVGGLSAGSAAVLAAGVVPVVGLLAGGYALWRRDDGVGEVVLGSFLVVLGGLAGAWPDRLGLVGAGLLLILAGRLVRGRARTDRPVRLIRAAWWGGGITWAAGVMTMIVWFGAGTLPLRVVLGRPGAVVTRPVVTQVFLGGRFWSDRRDVVAEADSALSDVTATSGPGARWTALLRQYGVRGATDAGCYVDWSAGPALGSSPQTITHRELRDLGAGSHDLSPCAHPQRGAARRTRLDLGPDALPVLWVGPWWRPGPDLGGLHISGNLHGGPRGAALIAGENIRHYGDTLLCALEPKCALRGSASSTMLHEVAEGSTDPTFRRGWYADVPETLPDVVAAYVQGGMSDAFQLVSFNPIEEIADLCQYGERGYPGARNDFLVLNGKGALAPALWSNAAGRCTTGVPRPSSARHR